MIIDKAGKIFDERRKNERRIQEVKVQNDRRVLERRNNDSIKKK